MNYYSQFGEDKVIIEEYFKDFTGGCIDIGASNGISINNTLALEETGWYCMCVEPNPTYFTELKENRYNAVNYAISDRNDELIFKIVNIGNGVEEAMSALTLDERLIQQHRDYGYPINITPIVVQAVTLDECIKRHYEFDTIDFISIDTEGTELDILKGFDIERWQPKLMIIENNFNDDDIEIYLSLFDYYKERRLGVNDFYVKKKDSYAEYNTDKHVLEMFDKNFVGTMIETGAGPTTEYSMSKLFREKGWRTICIEPNAYYVELHEKEGNEI